MEFNPEISKWSKTFKQERISLFLYSRKKGLKKKTTHILWLHCSSEKWNKRQNLKLFQKPDPIGAQSLPSHLILTSARPLHEWLTGPQPAEAPTPPSRRLWQSG